MTKRNSIIIGTIVLLTILAFSTFVWPTIYRYDHMNLNGTVLPVRINRISGKTEILYPSGWASVDTPQKEEQRQDTRVSLPVDELNKLGGNANFYIDKLSCSIYNGSSYRIDEIVIHISVTDVGSSVPEIDRDYRMKSTYFTEPLQTGIFEQYVGFSPQRKQKWSWDIKSALGVKH